MVFRKIRARGLFAPQAQVYPGVAGNQGFCACAQAQEGSAAESSKALTPRARSARLAGQTTLRPPNRNMPAKGAHQALAASAAIGGRAGPLKSSARCRAWGLGARIRVGLERVASSKSPGGGSVTSSK